MAKIYIVKNQSLTKKNNERLHIKQFLKNAIHSKCRNKF